jgi:hypothetical protein
MISGAEGWRPTPTPRRFDLARALACNPVDTFPLVLQSAG